jgi:DNA primase large subunit
MILGAMRNRFLTSKFAVAISKSARRSMNYDDSENVKKLIAEFGIRVRADGRVFIVDYLRFSPKDPHYSLFNRTFSNGWVQASEDEKKRLVEEAVRKHVENIPIVKNPSEQIKGIMARIDKELPKTEKKIMIKPGEYPPCIVHLLEEIRKHHNLPHHARWFLAVYLIEAGLKDDAIVAIYSNLPDFEEKKTRYQIEHARKRGYSIPSCATIASYGICTTECKVGSPVNWRRRR